jgi:hypothetical protein
MFLVVPEDGVMAVSPQDIVPNFAQARDIAEQKAISRPGTKYVVMASVKSVVVPIPRPMWTVEEVAPEERHFK